MAFGTVVSSRLALSGFEEPYSNRLLLQGLYYCNSVCDVQLSTSREASKDRLV